MIVPSGFTTRSARIPPLLVKAKSISGYPDFLAISNWAAVTKSPTALSFCAFNSRVIFSAFSAEPIFASVTFLTVSSASLMIAWTLASFALPLEGSTAMILAVGALTKSPVSVSKTPRTSE